MARLAIKAGKSGPKNVPTPGQAASFVLGSRPASIRAPAVPRVKPMTGQTQYGKQAAVAQTGAGDTGMTSRS